jgi:hypothetical protein
MINPGQNDVTRILPELVHDAGGSAVRWLASQGTRQQVDLVTARALKTEQLIALCRMPGSDLSQSELKAIQEVAVERADAKLVEAVHTLLDSQH